MKIIHVISSMTVEAGGPPFVCAGIARTQAALGHEVTIATVDVPGEQRLAVDPAVRVEYFPYMGSPRYAASPALARWLDGAVPQADIVHLHSLWQFPTYAGARACWKHGKPYVVLLNGMLDVYSVRQHNHMIKRLYWFYREGRVLSRAAGLHCLNRAEIRCAVDWIDRLPKFIVGNGVSTAELAALPPPGRFRAAHQINTRPLVLFLSRIHPKKGLDRLLPHWQRLLEHYPETIFAIAGAGAPDYLAEIDRLIREHGLTNSVRRVGQLAGAEKWAALTDADVFVLPSHQEGFSMAITEAMAAACPVVITEECNFDEVAAFDTGRIITDGDMPTFVDTVGQMLEDQPLARRLGANGRRLVESRYTWERVGTDLMDVYQWALRGRTFSIDGRDVWRPTTQRAGASPARPFRILHVIDTMDPAAGGPSTVISRLAAAQAALGHDVTVLTYLDASEQQTVAASLRGVPGVDRVKFEFVPKVSRFDRFMTISVKPHLVRLIDSVDVVHLHGIWEPLLAVAASMARTARVPYVVRTCGMLDPWSLEQRRLKKRVALAVGYRHMLNSAAFLHVLNRDEKHLVQQLGLTCPMEVISNGVFLEEVDPLPFTGAFRANHPELSHYPYIAFLGRLHPKKGLDYLAAAFALVAQQNYEVRLAVAGPDGGAADTFLRQIRAANLHERVHMVGPQYGQDKLAFLHDAAVFCLPSRQEGFSLAITEALACGVPVVISPACHFPEVAEADAGLIVDLEPPAIAQALLELLRDSPRRLRLGLAGKALVRERYTWPRVAEQTIAAYEGAVERMGVRHWSADSEALAEPGS